MKKSSSFLRALVNLDIAVSGVALVVLVVLTFCGVIARYAVGKPLSWIEEIQCLCIVWVVFGAAGAAFRTGSHVAIELIVDALPNALQKIAKLLITVIVVLTLLFLMKTSISYLQLFIRTGRTTSVLHISYVLIYVIAPVSCVLQIVNFFLVNVLGYSDEIERIEEVANQ